MICICCYTLLQKISCKQKYNSSNKEPHFVKEAQVESNDGVGKTGHLWEGLLISKISPISNSLGLPYTEKKSPVSQTQQGFVHLQI
jgi:hypothetical protein